MSKPHVHAAVIHAYADGAEIEFKDHSGYWQAINLPVFKSDVQYRVKPEPVRVYPETKMMALAVLYEREIIKGAGHGDALASLANAALRHAIDNSQVVPAEIVKAMALRLAHADAELVRALDPRLRLVQFTIEKDAETIFQKALAGEV